MYSRDTLVSVLLVQTNIDASRRGKQWLTPFRDKNVFHGKTRCGEGGDRNVVNRTKIC